MAAFRTFEVGTTPSDDHCGFLKFSVLRKEDETEEGKTRAEFMEVEGRMR
jgi:hypothetical protein